MSAEQLFVPPKRKRSVAKLTAAEVKQALRRRHGCDRVGDLSGLPGAWVCIEEAFAGWASAGGGTDLFAIGAWRSAKAPGLKGAGRHPWVNVTVAYEVKVSRADFRRELYGYEPKSKEWDWPKRPPRSVPPWPNKAHFALERSNYFLFAVPAGLLSEEEIERRQRPEGGTGLWLPPETGLIEVDHQGCRARVDAPARECRPLTAHETAELIRYALRNPERAAA